MRAYQQYSKDGASTLIYSGISLSDIDSFQEVNSQDHLKNLLGYKSHQLLILHLGRMVRMKGQIYTVKAYSLLKEKHPDIAKNAKCLMVGAQYLTNENITFTEEVTFEAENNKVSVSIIKNSTGMLDF